MSFSKKFLAGSLAAVMSLTALTGCTTVRKSDLSDDYSKNVVATYGDENIYLDEVNFILRNRQYTYEYYAYLYGINFWNSEDTINAVYEEVMQEVQQTRVLCEHASDYNVTLSEEEQATVDEAIKDIAEESDDSYFYDVAGRDVDMLTKVMTNNALANKVYYTIKTQCEITTDKNTCIKNEINYFLIDEPDEEETTEAATTTEGASEEATAEAASEAATEEATEAETEAPVYSEEDANKALERVKAGEGMEVVAQDYSKSVSSANYGVNEEQTSDLGKAAIALKEGDTDLVYIEGTGWYIIQCTTENDEEATESAYKTACDNEREEYFKTVYEGLSKQKFKVTEEVLSLLDIANTPVYGVSKETEATETEAGTAAATEEAGTTEAATEAATTEAATAEAATEAATTAAAQ